VPNVGYGSVNGFFASLNYNQLNVGGNAQTLSANVQQGTTGLLGDLSCTDPWIATDPNRTSYTVNAFARRSTSFVFGGGKTPLFVPGTFNDTPTILRTGGGITFDRPLNGDPDNKVVGAVRWGYSINEFPHEMSMVVRSFLKIPAVTI
jgi:outer membrane protein insertion porin family